MEKQGFGVVSMEGSSPSIGNEKIDPLLGFDFEMKMESNPISNSTMVEEKSVVTDIVPWEPNSGQEVSFPDWAQNFRPRILDF